MSPLRYRYEEGVDREALLDDFLQSITDRTITSPTTTKITPTNHSTAAAGVGIGGRVSHDGALGGWEEGEGEGKGEGGGGDIRAVTSGMISSNNGMLVESPEIGREADIRKVQAEVLRGLDFLFCSDRSLVESCVQVLDKSRVVNLRARTSGRSVWLVQGSRGTPYLCLGHYCSCRSFQELCRRGSAHPVLCKHLLAIRVAPALGLSLLEEVDDNLLAQRISACDYG